MIQEDIQLKLGKMTRTELAEWFQVKPNTYDHAKKKKLEELKIFADFKEIRGGVEITNIKIPVYAKKGSKAYNIIKDNFTKVWHKSGYDTASRVGFQIWQENKDLQDMISLQTAKAYTSRVRSEFYGRVYKKEMGTLGWCKYAYVVINQWDEAVLLNEEQNQKVNELIYRIYSNKQEPLMYEAYKEGSVTKEEYEEFQEDWKNCAEDRYLTFITELEKILGFCPTKVTRIINKEESAF